MSKQHNTNIIMILIGANGRTCRSSENFESKSAIPHPRAKSSRDNTCNDGSDSGCNSKVHTMIHESNKGTGMHQRQEIN